MATNYPLGVVLSFTDKLSGPWDAVMGKLTRGQRRLYEVGQFLSRTLTAPIVAFGRESIETGYSYQETLQRIRAASGATAADMVPVVQKLDEISTATHRGPIEAADALKLLVRQTGSLKDALGLVEPSLRLADVAETDVATSTRTLTDLLHAFGAQASDGARFANILAQGALAARQPIDEFGQGLVFVGPYARGLRIPLADVAAQFVALGDKGYRGYRAAQALGQAYRLLAKEGAAAKTDQLDLADAIDKVNAAGIKGSQLEAAFGRIAGATLADLAKIGSSGLRAAAELLRETNDLTAQSTAINLGAVGAARDLANEYAAVKIEVGQGLLPALTSLLRTARPVFDWIAHASPTTVKWALGLAAVTAALGPATKAMALFNAVLALNPIGLVVLGVAALAVAGVLLWKNWDTITLLWQNRILLLGEAFDWLADQIAPVVRFFDEKYRSPAEIRAWRDAILPDRRAMASPVQLPTFAPYGPSGARWSAAQATASRAEIQIRLDGFPPGTRVNKSGNADVQTDLGMSMIGVGSQDWR